MRSVFIWILITGIIMAISGPASARATEAQYDVLVIGGTASGFGAGVSAARMGSRVALIEETQRLGGMASNGLGATDIRSAGTSHGLWEEFRKRVVQYYGSGNGLKYEPKVADSIFKEIASEQPNLQIFYRTRAIGVTLKKNQIVSVQVEDLSTGKRREIKAKRYIDASIEGDVAAWAGADFRVGREPRTFEEAHAGHIYYQNNTGDILPGSTGAGDHRVQSYAYLMVTKDYGPGADKTIPQPDHYNSANYQYTENWESSWPNNSGRLPNNKYEMNQHPWGIDLPEINYDYPTASFARREEIAKRYKDQALGYLYYLQTERGLKNLGLPDDEFEENGGFPPTLYVREARRVMGRTLLKENDVTESRIRFQPTSIGIGDYPMDSHAMELPPSPNEAHRGEGEFFLRRQTPQFQVPAGVIIPNKIENLLVSSAVSATHVAYGALRMEPVRMIMGQAAGTLAALSLQYRQRPDEIKIDLLQDKLLDQNVYLAWFTDITPTSRHFKGIQFLGARGLFPNLQFEPEQQVTRGEAARWIFGLRQLLDPSLRPNTFGGPHYDDVPVSSPLFPFVESLYAAKVIQGGGRFKPQEPLARGEMARWLMLTMRQYDPKWGTKTTEAPVYTDVSEDSPLIAAIRGLAAEHINARSWRDPEGNTGESTNFYPGSAIARDDFAMTLFLAYRSIHPAF